METVVDTTSIASIKSSYGSLTKYFNNTFASGKSSVSIETARENFARSLAAYSIVCYLMNVKDRHDGNILIDASGHLLHIDFGYILSATPPSYVPVEVAPFKFTQEYVDILGGEDSALFRNFRATLVDGFLLARDHCEEIMLVARMLCPDRNHFVRLPCFTHGRRKTLTDFRRRFKLHMSRKQCVRSVLKMIRRSLHHPGTFFYDRIAYNQPPSRPCPSACSS